MMAKHQDIAKDLFALYGAFLSISDIARYARVSRGKVRSTFIDGLLPVGQGTGRRYFYQDVAKKMAGMYLVEEKQRGAAV